VHLANEQTIILKMQRCLEEMDDIVAKAALLARDAPRLRAALNAHGPLPDRNKENSLAEYSVMSAIDTINAVADAYGHFNVKITLDAILEFDWIRLVLTDQNWIIDLTQAVCERVAVPHPCRAQIDEMLQEMADASFTNCSTRVANHNEVRWCRTIDTVLAHVHTTLKEWMALGVGNND
jgi:hypothetical protein